MRGLPVSTDRQVLLGCRSQRPQVGEEAATVTRRRSRPEHGRPGHGHPEQGEGEGREGRAQGRRERAQGPTGRYGLLLFLLILTYLISAFTSGDWVAAAQLGLFAATGFLAIRSSELPLRQKRLIVVIGLAGSAAAVGLTLARPSDGAVAAAHLWTGLVLLATVVVIVRRILSFDTVTGQSIYAAISAYLILGLMFAAFFAAISAVHGGHFFADHQAGGTKTFQYFSFTTLTTLGYGDFTAAGNSGRAVAVVEALTGQIFLATLVARLVAAFRGPSAPPDAPRGARRPATPPPPPPPARQLPASMRPGRQPRRPPRPAARSYRQRPPPDQPGR